jgi:hypothetical protein
MPRAGALGANSPPGGNGAVRQVPLAQHGYPVFGYVHPLEPPVRAPHARFLRVVGFELDCYECAQIPGGDRPHSDRNVQPLPMLRLQSFFAVSAFSTAVSYGIPECGRTGFDAGSRG